MKSALVVVCFVFIHFVRADIYFHGPRGSNNRLNENSAQRRNANRAFNSENNNRGGYNVGDRTYNRERTDKETEQYQMEYFQSSSQGGNSKLYLEWTNQHGCGGDQDKEPHKLNCNVVIQFMCQPEKDATDSIKQKYRLRDGTKTDTPYYKKCYKGNPYDETASEAATRKSYAGRVERVYQESFESYDNCYFRQRNKGLFTADQYLRGDRAIYTRQNPNGNRYGFECTEEKDYYPYWHPTEWKDIAVFANDQTECAGYKKESAAAKGQCQHEYPNQTPTKCRHWSKYNNKVDCEANNGKWIEFHSYLEVMEPAVATKALCDGKSGLWGYHVDYYSAGGCAVMKCLVKLPELHCEAAPRTRVNHLGNTVTGQPMRYTWDVPHFPSGIEQRCFLRIRYNISTDDYDPHKTDSSSNANYALGQMSPIQQNPAVDIGADNQPLQLAINTAQTGRTFQDRTHLFKLVQRPTGVNDEIIHNINVRGKRGNIVQVYPAVEYDFFPNDLEVSTRDLVHFQWTGSNSHDNDSPGGDGQTGDAGEGRDGTDRHNIVEIGDLSYNYPLAYEASEMFKNAVVKWSCNDKPTLAKLNSKTIDIAVSYASAGYYQCLATADCDAANSVEGKSPALDNLLNNASPSYLGMLLRFKAGTYYYACTRNNNFTNRSQKGILRVVAPP